MERASAAEILQSRQKDREYGTMLERELLNCFSLLMGQREARLISRMGPLLYFLFSSVRLPPLNLLQTLGQEYCDIRPAKTSLLQTLSFLVLGFLVPLLLPVLPPSVSRSRLLTLLRSFFNQAVSPLHLALFYFNSEFYFISERLSSIRYILTRDRFPSEKLPNYGFLGILILFQQLFFWISKIRSLRSPPRFPFSPPS